MDQVYREASATLEGTTACLNAGEDTMSTAEACLPCRSTIARARSTGKRHRLVDEAGQLLDQLQRRCSRTLALRQG